MYLKSIEVHGFKSFAKKLIFEFHNGITGIVGPNGSGKSNVADAVRWVLGEQSAKQLRGASMQDVIFSGTELRKPQSYAYVALTIANDDHKLNVPYEEVQVARKVYRSGESEYLLNGVSCRLKDVQELFFDTGIGKEGYSIIGQGQIDKILSGKPEDRRELFDEAAGIVKYKKRKRTAEKNLEVEKQNLLRVNDIVLELEKQIGPLERQSEKAKEFLSLRDSLKNYEVGLFRMDYESLSDEIEEIKTNISNLSEDLKKAKEEKERSKEQYEEVDNQIKQFDESIEKNNTKKNNNEKLIAEFKSNALVDEEKITSTKEGKKYFQDRIDDLLIKKTEAKAELDDYLVSQKDSIDKLENMKKEESKLSEDIKKIEKDIVEQEILLSEENDKITELTSQSNSIKIDKQKSETQLEQSNIKKAELNQKILTNKSKLSQALEIMKSEKIKLDEIKKEYDNEYISHKQLLSDGDKKRKEILSLQNKNEENQKLYHMQNSKLDTLKNLSERYDGYNNTIKRIMEQKSSNKGLIGVVADIIKVDDKYQTAIETALGGNVQNIVTEDENVAKSMIEFIKKERAGRATFLPLTTVTPNRDNAITEDTYNEKGALGIASDFVDREKKYDNVVEYLLCRFLLVDNLTNASIIHKKYKHKIRIVTLEGELLMPGGSISGGSFKNNSNLLGRKKEIEKLNETVLATKEKMEQGRKAIEEARKAVENLVTAANEKNEQLKELEIKMNTAKLKYSQAEENKETIEQEYNIIANDGKEIETQKSMLSDSVKHMEERLQIAEKNIVDSKNLVIKLNDSLDTMHDKHDELQENINGIKLEISSFQQKNNYIQENIARMENAILAIDEEYNKLTSDQNTSDEKVESLKEAIEGYNKKIKELENENEKLENAVKIDIEKKEKMMLSQKDFFNKRDELVEHISDLDKENFRLDARKTTLEEKLDNKINYMWNEYEMTYRQSKEFDIDESISYTRMKSNVSETRTKIKNLGPVNVNAIEEFKELSKRYDLMKTQHDDLVESEAALIKIIEDLDVEMRKQFSIKFAEIKKQFDKVFKELFGGGKGTLELVEDEDVLDAGITINAQPPGKKLANMMQLSGGEKALTAIALLFAIQNLKPSPFCLLDEIEAALDDSNVKRYAKYLHKLTKNTQFIVITHRKGTMEAADTLYGITMQEKGVSTLVSVKLIEEQLDD